MVARLIECGISDVTKLIPNRAVNFFILLENFIAGFKSFDRFRKLNSFLLEAA